MNCAGLLAIKHANHRDTSVVSAFGSLTKNYSHVSTDSGSAQNETMSAYITLKTAGAVGIVGPAMSGLSVPVATVGGLDALPSMSYWSSSPTLANKEAYPYFARTFPSDDLRAPLILETLVYFNFTNFAVIHVNIR